MFKINSRWMSFIDNLNLYFFTKHTKILNSRIISVKPYQKKFGNGFFLKASGKFQLKKTSLDWTLFLPRSIPILFFWCHSNFPFFRKFSFQRGKFRKHWELNFFEKNSQPKISTFQIFPKHFFSARDQILRSKFSARFLERKKFKNLFPEILLNFVLFQLESSNQGFRNRKNLQNFLLTCFKEKRNSLKPESKSSFSNKGWWILGRLIRTDKKNGFLG